MTNAFQPLFLWTLCFGVSAVSASAQSPAIWRESSATKVTAVDLTPFGSVIALAKTGLSAIEVETGKRLWSRTDVTDYLLVAGTTYGLFTTAGGQTIANLESGQDIWNLASLGLSPVSGMIHLPSAGVLLAHGAAAESAHTLVAARYASGQIVWKQSSLFKDSALAPKAAKIRYRTHLHDSETSVILDPSDDGLIRLDLQTGQLLWRIPEMGLASKGKRVDLLPAGDRFLVAYDKKLIAVAREGGKVEWALQEGFPSPVVQAASTRQGLLVRGAYNVNGKGHVSWKPYLTMLDPATGATKWTTQKAPFEGRSSFVLENDRVVIAQKEGVTIHDATSGQTLSAHTMPEFGGGENACCIQRFENGGLLVWSSQNMRMIDPAGKVTYSVFLKAPGASFLAKLATVAAMAAATAGSYAAAPAGGAYSVFSPGPNSSLTARFKASTSAERFMYVLTEEPGTDPGRFALVRLDKASGKDTGRLKFADRSPTFRLDPASGVVVAVDDAGLYGLRFTPVNGASESGKGRKRESR